MSTWRTPWMTLLIALGGCGDEARISISAPLMTPLALQMLTVTVRDGGRVIQWTGADFKPGRDDPTPSTGEVNTETSGPDLEVTYRLENAAALVSTGTVILPRRANWRWGVTISAATADPAEFCLGCFGSTGFPLADAFRAPERDSVWMVWGGNSISDPAVY